MTAATDPIDPFAVTRILRQVRSIREFTNQPVPDDVLTDLLETARWTGSGSNTQPWTLVVVRDRATLRAVAEASPNTGHVGKAALAIFVVLDGGPHPALEGFDEARLAERILIAATAHGLASALGWVVAGARPAVADLLGVPPPRTVRTLISLGYATEAGARPKSPAGTAREPLADIVRWERFE
jgi:nitroreductase